MSPRAQEWQHVIDGCRIAPPELTQFYSRLWEQGRLNFAGVPVGSSGVDEVTSRGAAAAIRARGHVLFSLPDSNPRRPAVIFGSALLVTAIETLYAKSASVTVVLFGSTVQIRTQLASVRVRHLQLSSVFPQIQLQSNAAPIVGKADEFTNLGLHLPKVICAISPRDPKKILNRYRPNWIAVECRDQRDLQWLGDVADWAMQRQIPLIGWITGDRALVKAHAKDFHLPVFQWPILKKEHEESEQDEKISGEYVVNRENALEIAPLFLKSKSSDEIATLLAQTNVALARCQAASRSGVADDCLRLAWRYLRTVESLSVPVDFFNQECGAFWGLSSLTQLSQAVQRFVQAIRISDMEVAKLIDLACTRLDDAVDWMRSRGVPMWDGLRDICIGSSRQSESREIIFLTGSRRRLFELALLGLEGITPSDLESVGVRLRGITAQDLAAMHPINATSNQIRSSGLSPTAPVQVAFSIGVPTLQQFCNIHASVRLPINVLLFPYQDRLLRTRLSQYAVMANIYRGEQLRSLRECGMRAVIGAEDLTLSAEIAALEPSTFALAAAEAAPNTKTVPEWGNFFSNSEVSALLEGYGDAGNDDDQVTFDMPLPEAESPADIVIEKACEVVISGGRRGLFSPDFMLNVVRTVNGLDSIVERSVRSIKCGDRIVLVHGQRRQSLYELLLTRVHSHPSLQLHIALIKMWQEEIATSFAMWRKSSGKSYGDLLEALQASGSHIQSTLALRFWTEGKVLCPLDTKDLPRVAKILAMTFTLEHHGRIAAAAERLRGLHRGLAHKLNKWLRLEISGTHGHDNDDDVVDAELGLTFKDFKDSLEIVTVESYYERTGLFLAATLNSFRVF
jgi:hypothetical protein